MANKPTAQNQPRMTQSPSVSQDPANINVDRPRMGDSGGRINNVQGEGRIPSSIPKPQE